DKAIVHRDISPSNVIWDEQQNQLVLIDWGCAVLIADCGDGVRYCGSRAYKAHRLFRLRPEQLSNYVPDPRDDLGSLLLLVAGAVFVAGREVEHDHFASGDSIDWLGVWGELLPPAWW